MASSSSFSPPSTVGVLAVVPGRVPAGVDQSAMRRDDEVERVAMEALLAFERAAGREPEDVGAQKVGYDVRSRDGTSVRYIEVKDAPARGT